MAKFNPVRIADIVLALQGVFFGKLSHGEAVEIAAVLARGEKVDHFEILALTDGPGIHSILLDGFREPIRYEVPKSETYATVSNVWFLSGHIGTYVFQQRGTCLELAHHDIHMRS